MILVTGLGPGDFDRIPSPVREILLDPSRTVVVRTLQHPAAESLARLRQVVSCDDLYQTDRFEDVYEAIADRVLSLAAAGEVVYAVPGSPLIGEFAVRRLLASSGEVEILPAESFLDAVLLAVGYDPLDRGLQVLDGHHLPQPLVVDKPTVIAHLDRPEVLAEVAARLSRVLPTGAEVTVLRDAGGSNQVVETISVDGVKGEHAGLRTSMFVDADPGGLIGAVRTMTRLRAECPWDREQTHQSLVKNLVEETFELIEALGRLPEETDWAAYAEVEDELGDVLLQVLFQAAIAAEAGVFDIDDVAQVLTEKLVRRHPHVFGEVEVASAAEVKENWDRIKATERGDQGRALFEGVPEGMPALHRAAKILNRAAKAGRLRGDLETAMIRLRELAGMPAHPGEDTIGELLLSLVDLSRLVGVDPELALRAALRRFEETASQG